MGSPIIWGPSRANNLTEEIITPSGVRHITNSTVDPSSVATTGAAGSTLHDQSGNMYLKQDAGSTTNWSLVADVNITNWTSFTPTGSWSTNSTWTGYWRRVGDSMEVNFKVALSGAPDSAALTVNLPDSEDIDAAKIVAGVQFRGQALIHDDSTGDFLIGLMRVDSGTTGSLKVSYFLDNGNYEQRDGVTQAAPITFAASDYVIGFFSVPISGWSI